jgi:C1A family cysteine protease
MVTRKYGWVPDIPDKRDLFLKVSLFRAIALPSKVDLRSLCSDVENQESIGSCSAQSFVAAMEYLDRKEDNQWTDLSRLFVYYNTRGDKKNDTGGYLRDGIKALAKYGACDEQIWPYVQSKFAIKPPRAAYADGLKRRITEYRRIESLTGVKQSLADGFPVVFGFAVYSSFESDEVAKTGIMSLPSEGETMIGGHAVIAVGYDDSRKCLIVRNSWGKEWGDAGYFYMPYSYAEDTNLTADWWSIIRIKTSNLGLDNPADPDVRYDVEWYIPITGIIKVIWGWIVGKKKESK